MSNLFHRKKSAIPNTSKTVADHFKSVVLLLLKKEKKKCCID